MEEKEKYAHSIALFRREHMLSCFYVPLTFKSGTLSVSASIRIAKLQLCEF